MIKPLFLCFSLSAIALPRAWGEEPVRLQVVGDPPASSIGEPSLLGDAREASKAGQWREARRKIKKFIKDNETSAEAWTLLGHTYLATGADKKGLKRFNKALKFDPHFAPAYVGRGEYYEKKGRRDEAANEFRAATLSDPTSLEAREALARITEKPPLVISGDSDDRERPTGPTAPTLE
ncbi:MAG: tetratricopeptide repeat protein [Elusimicrobia bacterium]|nr:tetratricopeptide repeat protein [Elusimicrobiota bacterium]